MGTLRLVLMPPNLNKFFAMETRRKAHILYISNRPILSVLSLKMASYFSFTFKSLLCNFMQEFSKASQTIISAVVPFRTPTVRLQVYV